MKDNVNISSKVFIGSHVEFCNKVVVEDYCFIDSHVTIGYPSAARWSAMIKEMRSENLYFHKVISTNESNNTVKIGKGTIIRKGVTIGTNVIIGENCDIGMYSCIGSGCHIGKNSKISLHSSVGENSTLGCNVICGEGVRVGDDNEIGSFTKIFRNTVISHNVVIGENCRINGYISNKCLLGKRVSMLGSLLHKYKIPIGGLIEKSCILEDDVTVGMNASIIGVKIEKGSYIGAGAVVTKNVPPNVVLVGVPAKKIK